MLSALALVIFSCTDMFVLYLWLISCLEYFSTWLCWVFTCTKKPIVTEYVPCVFVLSDFIFPKNTWKPWVSEGLFHYSLLFWSPLAYWEGVIHIYDCWIDVHAQCVNGELYQSYAIFSTTDWNVHANRYVDEFFISTVNIHSELYLLQA